MATFSRMLNHGAVKMGHHPTSGSFGKRSFMMENSLRHLYVEELKDLYNAENQLVKALPKMAKAATSEELRAGFEEHLEQTKGHFSRLEKFSRRWTKVPRAKSARAWRG
jgi:ferritin-like metal-binding protein YciE